jgi:hypothetical protein
MMIVKLTKTFPIRVLEWLLAGIMLSWSIACWNLDATAWSQPTFSGLARIADHGTWAFIAFWIATIRLTALTINGAWRPSPHLRAAGAFIACFMWLQITLGVLAAEVSSTAIAVYPWLLLADIYNVFRASHDARVSDDRARVVSGRGRQRSANTAAH